MSSSPPPDPSSNRGSSLRFDDLVGIFVAFVSIGAIFWYLSGQSEKEFDLSQFKSFSSPPLPTATPPSLESHSVPVPPQTNSFSSKSQSRNLEPPLPSQPASVPVVPLPVPYQPSQPAATGFSDVPAGFWASPFIAVITQRGIMEGFSDQTFQPERPVTRAEFALMLQRGFDRSAREQALQFQDLPSGDLANRAIERAVQMGFMKGYPGQFFRPDQPIPKVESLVALANGLKLAKTPGSEQLIRFYEDNSQIPPYAVDEVAAATTAGLVVNYPNPKRLDPQKMTNRAEAAALIYQALLQSGQVEKINSSYIVKP